MSAASVRIFLTRRTKGLLSQLSVQLVLNGVVHCLELVSLLLFSCGATSLVSISAHSLSTDTSPCIVDLVEHRSAYGHLSVGINLVRGAKGIHIQLVVQHDAESPAAFTCYNVVGLHLCAQSVNQRILSLAVFSSTSVQASTLVCQFASS